jgi:hypothetical protein
MQSLGKSNLLSHYDGIMIDMDSVNIIIITVCSPEDIHDFILPFSGIPDKDFLRVNDCSILKQPRSIGYT